MKCQVRVEELRRGLGPHQRLGGSLGLGQPNPLTVTSQADSLSFSSADPELLITTSCSAQILLAGRLTISARILAEFVSLTKDPVVSLELKGEFLEVSGRQSSAKLRTLMAGEVAPLPPIGKERVISFPSGSLSQILRMVIPSVGSDPHRPILSGISFWGDRELSVVATDSFRLSEVTTTLPYHAPSVVMSGRAAVELSRSLSPSAACSLALGEQAIEVTSTDLRLIGRSVAGQYPEYRKIIPTEVSLVAELEREALIAAVKLAGLFSRTSGPHSIRLLTEREHLIVRGTSEALGEEETKLTTRYTGSFKPLQLTVNAKYLLDGLLPLSATTVPLGLSSADQPVVIRSEIAEGLSFLYLVMPLHDQATDIEEIPVRATEVAARS